MSFMSIMKISTKAPPLMLQKAGFHSKILIFLATRNPSRPTHRLDGAKNAVQIMGINLQ